METSQATQTRQTTATTEVNPSKIMEVGMAFFASKTGRYRKALRVVKFNNK